jgi:hypothetical protein
MRAFLGLSLAAVCWFAGLALAWDQQPDGYEVIDGPDGPDAVDAWRRDWAAWRKMELLSSRYDPEDGCNVYNLQETQWTQRNFVQTFLLMSDRAIYDREAQQYTVDKYVDEMQTRLGPLDSVLLWPAYPNIGIDNRNQWDLLRDLPGGVRGVTQVVADFHRRGVRVIIPYNPWDVGTRDVDGLEDMVRMYTADIASLNEVVPELQADGFNGDTMYGVPQGLLQLQQAAGGHARGRRAHGIPKPQPDELGLLLGLRALPARSTRQVPRVEAPGAALRAVVAGQDGRAADRLLQRRRVRRLGERVGHLERDDRARR